MRQRVPRELHGFLQGTIKLKEKLTVPIKKSQLWDFPGGPVVKTSPSNAGGASSSSGQGAKIPHASGQNRKT